jgi:hypothetical protein
VAATLDVIATLAEILTQHGPLHTDEIAQRQAADEPTRRGDLIKLLDSFPADEDVPGRMSAERLRSALGLQ